MNIFIIAYSIWVSLIRRPSFSRVRLRVLRTKGGWVSWPDISSAMPERRMRASTRAVSSAGEKGFVT